MLTQRRTTLTRRSVVQFAAAGSLTPLLSCGIGLRDAEAAAGTPAPQVATNVAGLLPSLPVSLSISAVLPATGPSTGGTQVVLVGGFCWVVR